jgi:hypothetical protein
LAAGQVSEDEKMKIEWDLDVDVVTFRLTSGEIDRQDDEFPVVLDLDVNGQIVEIEVILPVQLDVVESTLNTRSIDETTMELVLNTIGYANMRSLTLRVPAILQPQYVADPSETTVREFQVA